MIFTYTILGLSLAHWLVIASVGLSLSGSSVYIRDTLRGTTKPNRVSFFLWTCAPAIGVAAALSAHADGWATVRIFMSGLMPFLILLASFVNPQSYWKLNTFDFLCGFFSAVALILWALANEPRLAILFAAVGDGFACLPTLIKAWKYPETETGISYVTSLLASLTIMPTITVWNIENAAFQIYLLTASTLLIIAVYRKKITNSLMNFAFIKQN